MSYEIVEIGLLTAKKETTYNVDPVPTIGANAIPIESGKWDPQSTPIVRKPLDGAILTPIVGFNTMKHGKVTFTYELRGNRTDGIAADISQGNVGHLIEIDPLLQACNLLPTYVAESSGGARDGYVTYTLKTFTDNTDPSVTLYVYSQGKLHKLTGARGNVKFRWSADKIPYADFEFHGFYVTPADNTFPAQGSIVFLNTKPPLFSGGAVALGGAAAPKIQNYELDLGNDIQLCPDAAQANGVGRFLIVDRNVKGKIDPEADSIANWPVFADFEASTVRVLSVGTPTAAGASGNRVQLFANVEFKDVSYADRNKLRIHSLAFDVVRGNLSTLELNGPLLSLQFS